MRRSCIAGERPGLPRADRDDKGIGGPFGERPLRQICGVSRHGEGGCRLQDINRSELMQMIADYMEKGFLSNIVAMFKADPSLYAMVGDLLMDERLMVRVGMTALMEELQKLRPLEARQAVVSLLPLLRHESPTARGDAAYLIGLVGKEKDLAFLRPLLQDRHPQVVEIVKEILERR